MAQLSRSLRAVTHVRTVELYLGVHRTCLSGGFQGQTLPVCKAVKSKLDVEREATWLMLVSACISTSASEDRAQSPCRKSAGFCVGRPSLFLLEVFEFASFSSMKTAKVQEKGGLMDVVFMSKNRKLWRGEGVSFLSLCTARMC